MVLVGPKGHTNIVTSLNGRSQSLDQGLHISNTLVEPLASKWMNGMSGVTAKLELLDDLIAKGRTTVCGKRPPYQGHSF